MPEAAPGQLPSHRADMERGCLTQTRQWRGVAVLNAPPELAADIDTLEEYRYAVAVLQPA